MLSGAGGGEGEGGGGEGGGGEFQGGDGAGGGEGSDGEGSDGEGEGAHAVWVRAAARPGGRATTLTTPLRGTRLRV